VQRCGKIGPVGQPQAEGSEYLELHEAFSIALRAPGAALLSKVWFPCRARQRMNCFQGRRCGQEQARRFRRTHVWHLELGVKMWGAVGRYNALCRFG